MPLLKQSVSLLSQHLPLLTMRLIFLYNTSQFHFLGLLLTFFLEAHSGNSTIMRNSNINTHPINSFFSN